MIELVNVTRYYHTDKGPHYVMRDVSLRIPRNINVAIIGPNGAGKSTLLRLLAGVDLPNSGRIVRTGRISWPMGLTPSVQTSLTGTENTRFACRIYGMPADDIRATIEKVRDIAGIGKYFDLPVSSYSSGMKNRLGFAISISLDFDYYLFDEIGAGGDKSFKKMASELIEKRLSSANFIMTSHVPSDVVDLCQSAILLRDGKLTWYDDVIAALEDYGEREFLAKREAIQNKKANTAAQKPGARGAARRAGLRAEAGVAAAATAPANMIVVNPLPIAARASLKSHTGGAPDRAAVELAAGAGGPTGAVTGTDLETSRREKREDFRQRKIAERMAKKLATSRTPAEAADAVATPAHRRERRERFQQRKIAERESRREVNRRNRNGGTPPLPPDPRPGGPEIAAAAAHPGPGPAGTSGTGQGS